MQEKSVYRLDPTNVRSVSYKSSKSNVRFVSGNLATESDRSLLLQVLRLHFSTPYTYPEGLVDL